MCIRDRYKEQYIKDTAKRYKDKIPYSVYEAMMNWKVEITDWEGDIVEQNEELQGCVFAVPSKTPWITSKSLVHKKNQHSEEYLRMKRIFRENDFSVHTDPETGEIVCQMCIRDRY